MPTCTRKEPSGARSFHRRLTPWELGEDWGRHILVALDCDAAEASSEGLLPAGAELAGACEFYDVDGRCLLFLPGNLEQNGLVRGGPGFVVQEVPVVLGEECLDSG